MVELSRSRIFWALLVSLSLIATCVLGASYINDQQILRQSADEPQVWLAHDTAERIARGENAEKAIWTTAVNISYEYSPFVIVYDRNGSTTASSGILEDKETVLPLGVLEYAKTHGEHRVTWAPYDSPRIAAVIVPVGGGAGGYVLSGRSLVFTEEQIAMLLRRSLILWLATLIVAVLVSWFATFILVRRT